ncbi:hypothetical protein BGZ72_007409 [Mortierella alpina]|nr:hypothetical protein BGZ72_007409 [Mortierella alpina]
MRFTTTIFSLAVLAASTQAIETAASGDADAAKILLHPITYPKHYPVRPYRPPKVYPRSELSAAAAPQDQGENKIAIHSDDMDYEDENSLDEEGNDKFVMPYHRRRWWGRRPYWYRPYRYRRYWY